MYTVALTALNRVDRTIHNKKLAFGVKSIVKLAYKVELTVTVRNQFQASVELVFSADFPRTR